jgi:hypothetical protein
MLNESVQTVKKSALYQQDRDASFERSKVKMAQE